VDRPTIPENLEALSLDELRSAVAEMRPFAEAQITAETPDVEFLNSFSAAAELLTEKITAESERTAALARATEALSDTAVEDAPAEDAETEGDDAEDADETEDADEDAAAETETDEVTDADADAADQGEQVDRSDDATEDGDTAAGSGNEGAEETEVDRPSAEDLSGQTGAEDVESTPQVVTTATVLPGVPGFTPDTPIESRRDVALALANKWETVGASGTGERFAVVQIRAEYPDFADLSDGDFSGLYDDAIVAACAPLTPYYNVGFYSSTRRPVFDSAPKFRAPRGGVSIYGSPLFSDADLIPEDTGFGQWTTTDDNNPSAEKNDCYDFVCGDTTDYRVYGVYRCMNIRNLDAITFPELVAAHENQLESRFARYADKLLLDAMVAQADAVVHASATYGAVRTILSRFDQIASRYRENERLDDTPILDVWMPRLVRNILRQDVIRAWNDSGVPEVVVDATINGWFGDIGIVPHFTLDNPTLYGDYATQGTAHVLANPDDTWYIMSVRGNLAILDLGAINIGVNPNGTYRDTTLNKRNRFQMFMESFEGLVNRGFPVWRGQIAVLANGSAPTGAALVDADDDI